METDMARGSWIDPRHSDVPLATWAEELLSLARRLSPSTQETYRRDLTKYVLPALGAYRLGVIPPDQIENWLNDELEAGIAASSVHRHYRTLRRVLQVAVDKQKILANPCDRVEPPRVPKREMVFLDWTQAVDLAEAHSDRYRALIYLAVDSGMRWSELIGLRRSKLDLRLRKVRVTRAADPTADRRVGPQGAQDAGVDPVDHHLSRDRRDARPPPPGLRRAGPRRPGLPERRRSPDRRRELLEQPLLPRPDHFRCELQIS
jgi:integrase